MLSKDNIDSEKFLYKKQFVSGFAWNLFDSIITQGLLIIHNVLVRQFIGIEFHGLFGSLLSSFYFLLVILNLGLNYSLAPYISQFIKSKNNLRSFVIKHFVPHIVFIIFCSIIFFLAHPYIISFIKYERAELSGFLFLIMSLTIVSESIKKILKTFLQLVFCTKVAALTEVSGMYLYILVAWAGYLLGFSFNLVYCWAILLFISVAQMLIYFKVFSDIYTGLDNNNNNNEGNITSELHKKMFKTRCFIWSNQVCTELFSTNFLVPLSAFYFGASQASFFKIVSSLARWIILIIQKGFGVSSSALLAHSKKFNSENSRRVFDFLSFIFHQLIYVISVFIIINAKKIVLLQLHTDSIVTWSGLYFILLTTLADSLSVLYSSWFIIQEKANYFFLFNFFNISVFLTVYYFFPSVHSLFAFFLLLFLIRFTIFIVTSCYAYLQWNIKPNFMIHLKTGFIALIFSLIFYFLM